MAKADKRFDSLPTLTKAEDFDDWKRDILIWKAITSIEDAKQGPVLYRSLDGQAKKGLFQYQGRGYMWSARI